MAVTVPRRKPKNPEGRMPLRAHLQELRRRLTISLLAITLGAVLGWYLGDQVLNYLIEPLKEIAKERGNNSTSINSGDVLGFLNLKIKLAFYLGLIVASPVWLYQMWAFVVPGLTKREKRYGLGFTFTGALLFCSGIYLGWIWLPRAVILLTEFTPEGGTNYLDAQSYFAFVTRLMLAFGLAFVVPLFLVALNFVGVLPGAVMIKHWRISVFLVFLFAAIVSPSPDPGGMLALALPMIGLYLAAAGIGLLNDRRRRRAMADHEIFDLGDEESSPLARSDFEPGSGERFTPDDDSGFDPRVDDDAT
ncbi:twin-arginine translocase subunit TatC [Spongisporangium articulatum]|uniref:Sec-independent protein translocase protein TatC n=1 Tax=Spongisporangium articulatum TaxID=3362603 RepID=A0ABW8AT92_9ACTN